MVREGCCALVAQGTGPHVSLPASMRSCGASLITADTALRLARYLGTSPDFWLGLQLEYDLRVAQQAKQKDIERVVRPRSEAA